MPSSARSLYDATISSRYKRFSFNQKPVTAMSRPTTTNSTQLHKSISQTSDLEATLSQGEDLTESLTDLINNSFTLLERLEEAAESQEYADSTSIETIFYSIESHVKISAKMEPDTSIPCPPSAPSTLSPRELVSNGHPNDIDIDLLIDLVQADNLLTVTGKLKIMEAIMRENDLAKAYMELSQMRKTIRILWYEERFPGDWLAFGTAASENASKVMLMPPATKGRV